MENRADRVHKKGRLNTKWFGAFKQNPTSRLCQYRIAARRIAVNADVHECYAPDPDDDNLILHFNVSEDYLTDLVVNSNLIIELIRK